MQEQQRGGGRPEETAPEDVSLDTERVVFLAPARDGDPGATRARVEAVGGKVLRAEWGVGLDAALTARQMIALGWTDQAIAEAVFNGPGATLRPGPSPEAWAGMRQRIRTLRTEAPDAPPE